MFGFTPRNSSDALLKDEISKIPSMLEDLLNAREEAAQKNKLAQDKQKSHFDKKRKKPHNYKEGDLVVILKQVQSVGSSRKLKAPYSGPMVVKAILPNDRYIVMDMDNSHRTNRSTKYEKTIAVDRMRPWCPPGGVSDDTDSASGEDGVVLSSDEEDKTDF